MIKFFFSYYYQIKQRLISKTINLSKLILIKVFNIEIKFNYKNKVQISYEKILSNKNSLQKEKELEKISHLIEYEDFKPYILDHLFNTQLYNSNPKAFLTMNRYLKAKKEWRIKNHLKSINIDFLRQQLFTGSLGNYIKAYEYYEAQKYGLSERKDAIFCMPLNAKITNNILFSYIKNIESIKIIHNKDLSKKLYDLQDTPLDLPLGHGLEVNNNFIYSDFAYNYIIQKKHSLGKKLEHQFTLSKDHYEEGWLKLKKIGLTDKNWWVTIHARSGNSKNDGNTEFWREGNIKNFEKAIQYIKSLGGIIFRMGDNKMPKMKEENNVIDYAHSDLKSPLMDIFLGALSKFHLGSDSGYPVIPKMFGVPSMISETPSAPTYFALNDYDVWVPKLYIDKSTRELVKFEKAFNPPYSLIWFQVREKFKKMNIELVNNDADDILAGAKLLYKISNNNKIPPEDTDLQKKFKKAISNTGKNHHIPKLKAFGNIPDEFLQKYNKLL